MIYVLIENYKSPYKLPGVFLVDLLTGKAEIMLYYVFVYCEFTLLVPLIDKIARSKYRFIAFAISPLEIIIMRLVPLMLGFKMPAYIEMIMSISFLGWFTYYYLGYLLGNGIITIKIKNWKLVSILMGSIILQMCEGYWYLSMGDINCGTQLKLSTVLTGVIVSIIAYRYINSSIAYPSVVLKKLGYYSFGIYFSHMAVIKFMTKIPHYTEVFGYPFNAIAVIIVSFICVEIGRKILGKYGKYLAL